MGSADHRATHLRRRRMTFPLRRCRPGFDLRVAAKGDQDCGRRGAKPSPVFLKTHLPVDALVFSPRAKYIYIARDGRDVVWSLYNHHVTANDSLVSGDERLAGPRRSADRQTAGSGPAIFHRVARTRRLSVLALLGKRRVLVGDTRTSQCHAAAFCASSRMTCQRRSAASPGFLDIPIEAPRWPVILEHCGF